MTYPLFGALAERVVRDIPVDASINTWRRVTDENCTRSTEIACRVTALIHLPALETERSDRVPNSNFLLG